MAVLLDLIISGKGSGGMWSTSLTSLVEYLIAAILALETVTHMSGTWPDVKDEVFRMCSGAIFTRIDYDDI